MINYIVVPGLGGSGPEHWQTHFENTHANVERVIQPDWDAPVLSTWAENVEKVVAKYDAASVVLVAHSLGCLTVLEWVKRFNGRAKAALLVAPPDTEAINKKLNRAVFLQTPTELIPFPTTLVASTNDHWATIDRAEWYARQWGSEFINIGAAGHINAESGYGQWDEGIEILKRLG